jgi:hypothetical protein
MVTAAKFLLRAIPVTAGVEAEERAHGDAHRALWEAATTQASECAFTMSSNAGRTRAVTASPVSPLAERMRRGPPPSTTVPGLDEGPLGAPTART